jgi:DNA-directed RNA polymerase subunit H (RpoH/RPB5)
MRKISEKQSFDIHEHVLVPRHETISEEEKKQLFEKYNITPDQLPKILDTDPVSKSIGARSGQIVKIIRKSHTAKESVGFRLVVESNE